MAQPTLWTSLPLNSAPTFDAENDTIIRQSTIGQLMLCEMRVGYRDTEGYLEPVGEKLSFGTFVHHLIEQHLILEDEPTELLVQMDWVNEILVDDYDWSIDQVDDPVGLFSEIAVAYRTWQKQILPKLKLDELVAVEETMFLYLGEGNKGNIFLQGSPDAVFQDHLRDWKTAGRGWKKEKADVSIQASLYPALAKQTHDLKARKFTFDVYDRSKSVWTSFPVMRRVADIDSALKTAYAAGLKVESGLYTAQPVPEASFNKKRGWYCSTKFCPAWNVCEYKYLADGINEKTVAIRSWS